MYGLMGEEYTINLQDMRPDNNVLTYIQYINISMDLLHRCKKDLFE